MIADEKSVVKDDAELLARIRQGDPAACSQCIEDHAPGIFRLALRLTQNEADAEDILQETFISAFKSIATFEGRAGLGTWLYRIAYNTAMMKLRKQNPPLVSVDDVLAPAEGSFTVPQQLFDWCCLPETDFETEEVHAELQQAIVDLPETLRTVFILRELEGLSTVESAEVLGISDSAVKKRLERARLWLRERLSDYFAEWLEIE